MKTVALVESPAQLLNVIEWAHHEQAQLVPGQLSVLILAPTGETTRWQLRGTAKLAREAGLGVSWHEPRLGGAATARTIRALASDLAGVERLVLGDPFSGVMQVVASLHKHFSASSGVAEVVIVDDGTATLEFARQWSAGEHLRRWHQVATTEQRRHVTRFARKQISESLRRRLEPSSGCRLVVFSCLPVVVRHAQVVRNSYGWLRSRHPRPWVKQAADLIGTSLVETGVVAEDDYLAGIASLVGQHGADRYFAHRKEDRAKLTRIAELGLRIELPQLPLEVSIRDGAVGRQIITFPSTLAHTLPVVLADTGVAVVVCDVDPTWYTPAAGGDTERFLDAVTSTARRQHGLASAAC